MSDRILIVEDETLIAYDIKLMLLKAGYSVCGVAESVADALEIVNHQAPDVVLLDIFLKGKLTGIDLGRKLAEKNIPFIYLSANIQDDVLDMAKPTGPSGFLVKPFRESELLVMLNVVLYRHRNSRESKLRQEEILESSLISIGYEILDLESKLLKIAKCLHPYLPFDFLNISSSKQDQYQLNGINLLRKGCEEYQFITEKEFLKMAEVRKEDLRAVSSVPGAVRPGIYNGREFQELCNRCAIKRNITILLQLRSMLCLPIVNSDGAIINIFFYNRRQEGYTTDDQKLLTRLQHSLIIALEKIISAKSSNIPFNNDSSHQQTATGQVKGGCIDGIIGDSQQMRTIMDQISITAPIDTSILILGESGTGKERVAKSIHKLSARKDQPLIVVNCASIQESLIESELFGHEKGSFTGATDKRIGKFELAHKGTIFLDEIGEMPIEQQPKLLRVLQEQEIERIGGKGPIKIDVRVIAATNRDLEAEISAGRFRLDLYYRLCVFPIIIPALRERKEDIPNLADHFIRLYSRKFNKKIKAASPEVMDSLLAYHWPGNIRELENFIERSVLLCKGEMLTSFEHHGLSGKNFVPIANPSDGPIPEKSFDDNMRDHLLTILRNCNGRISGPGGAAEKLGMPATTLHSKLRKLGLRRNNF